MKSDLMLQAERMDAVVMARGRAELAAYRSRERKNQSGYVYFLRAGNEVKIGFSTNPRGRLSSLRIAIAGDAFIARLVEGTREKERHFHKRFSEYRVRGEWFDLRGRLAKYLERHVFPLDLPGRIPPPPRTEGHL